MVNKHPRINPQWSLLGLLHRLTDAGCIGGALALVLWVEASQFAAAPLAVACAIVAHYLIAELTSLYRRGPGVSAEREAIGIFTTWLIALPVLLLAAVLAMPDDLPSRNVLVAWILVAPALMGIARFLIRLLQHALRSRGLNTQNFAIVGVNELGFRLAQNIEQSVHLGLRLKGFYDDRPAPRTQKIPPELGARLGSIDELVEDARQGKVSIIYITFPMRAEYRIRGVLEKLGDTTASVYLVPDFFVYELLHSRWTDIAGLPVVSVFENPLYGVDGMLKRVADICLASVFLLIAAIPMLIIALAIKKSSRGPVFFRQARYGLNGQQIKVWKFRTMHVCEDGAAVVQATRGDPRVTRIGAILRKSSLDELPQLFNVLEGSMSLVGPRPHANTHNELYRKAIHGYMLRHKVKPGITGLAQVNGWRGETDTLYKMQKRIEYDHEYIRQWSPWLDLKILFKTIITVFTQPNAY
jgi:putative colanic acid biosysnthesis UDP-glucose lipid carrier transferase